MFASFFVLVNAIGTFCSSAIADAAGYAPAFVTGTVLAAVGCVTLVYALDRKPVPERLAKAWLLTNDHRQG